MKNLKKLLLDNCYLIFLAVITCLFFYPTIFLGKIPIPADTIVGMYHPWRDKVWDNFIAGVPYKNFLTTDPVRQQYVWRKLAIEEFKRGSLPLWNPYSFSGTPLLANFQTAAFYPLNILFFMLPFNFAWTVLVVLQPLLGGIFLYLYLRFMKVSKGGSFLGGFTFVFSGFSIAWLEWNTIVQTVMWLPLILLAKEHLLKKISARWVLILIFAEVSQIFAGHLQLLFYALIISNVYLIVRIGQIVKQTMKKGNIFANYLKVYFPFLVIGIFVISATVIQWLPTLKLILYSGRGADQNSFLGAGWFIPWQNLIQFIVPDFFGNPATNNYWGVWNYGEFIGFIGIIPLILALYALVFRRDKKILFFGSLLLLSIIFAFPTPIARLPFILKIPFISTSQPSRLMFILDFSLCILAALGFDQFWKDNKIKKILVPIIFVGALLFIFWLFAIRPSLFAVSLNTEYISIAKRNLILPTIFIILSSLILILIPKTDSKLKKAGLMTLLVLVIIELFRFGWKFTPFSKEEWIFPNTKILETLEKDRDLYRILSLDRRIMPPNFSLSYKLEDVSGYDPLYLQNYGQLVAAWDRGNPDIRPASFNRIITPTDYKSFVADLLGIKYILSFDSLKDDSLTYVSQEGNTYLYENTKVFPRVFLVENVIKAKNDQDVIDKMFSLRENLRTTAVAIDNISIERKRLQSDEAADVISYSPDNLIVQTKTTAARLLVLTDIYYPSWQASVDGKAVNIVQVDFAFRGILIPVGTHTIELKDNLL